MPRLTIWINDKTYDEFVDYRAKLQKEKKRGYSMSKIIVGLAEKGLETVS